MYDQDLIELYNKPLNYLEKKAISAVSGENSSCGDNVNFYFSTLDSHFNDLKWSGSGCVISQVSVSLLTQKIIEENLSFSDVLALTVEDLLSLLNQSSISPGRIKCLTLGLNVLQKKIKEMEQNES